MNTSILALFIAMGAATSASAQSAIAQNNLLQNGGFDRGQAPWRASAQGQYFYNDAGDSIASIGWVNGIRVWQDTAVTLDTDVNYVITVRARTRDGMMEGLQLSFQDVTTGGTVLTNASFSFPASDRALTPGPWRVFSLYVNPKSWASRDGHAIGVGVVARDTTAWGQYGWLHIDWVQLAPALPQFFSQPEDTAEHLDSSVTLTSNALGAVMTNRPLDLRYQWYKTPAAPVLNATNAVLTMPRLNSADAGSYYVIASNHYGSGQSSNATVVVLPPGPAPFTDLKGNWKTTWDIDGTNRRRFYLKITKSGATYRGLMDDLDQGLNNIPAVAVSNGTPSVTFDFSNMGYHFQGILNSDFTQISGTWSNGTQSWPMVYDRQPSVDEMQGRTASLPYRLFVPENRDQGRKYPLVLFLHGAGERGSDNRLQITGQSGVLAFLFDENQAKQPCFLVAPQCPTSGTWVDTPRHSQLLALIAALKTEFNIDADRVYVTGLSLGGQGAWDLLSLNGNLFAAGIPMSGFPGTRSVSATAAAVHRIPIWNFHSFDDSTVNVSNSRNLINAIRTLGGTPVYTEFATAGHSIWTASYATPLLYDWVMAQRRGAATNVPPYVISNSPSDHAFHATAESTVSLAGTAGDAFARVSRITWTNNRGGSGQATGTNNWSIPSIALQTGTNLITAMATGTAWVPVYGGSTTFSEVIQIERNTLPILSITRANESVNVTWTGGVAPYSLERSTNITSALWETISTTTGNSVSVPADRTEVYFRVRSQ